MRAILFIILAAVAVSCTSTMGNVVPASHYVYPNSNVVPLGATEATLEKSSVLLYPTINAQDIDALYSEALRKHSGADLVIDYNVDTKITSIWIFHKMSITIKGTAAKMEVGRQNIGQEDFDKP